MNKGYIPFFISMSKNTDNLIGKSLVSRRNNRVYIPKSVMEHIDIKDGDYIGFFKVGEDIVIKKMELVVAKK